MIGVLRDTGTRLTPQSEEKIRAGDLLLVCGRVEDILRVKTAAGIEIKSDFKLSDRDLRDGEMQLFEVMILRGSDLIGRTLKRLRFREQYGLTVLALNRHGVSLLAKMSDIPLRFGDVLLVQGRREDVERLVADGNLLLLQDVSRRSKRVGKQRWAIAAFLFFLILSVTQVVPLVVAVMAGVLLLIATRTINAQEIYDFIEWRLIVLIAGLISFSAAMEKTGTDRYLAGLIVRWAGDYGGMAVLAGFFLLTVLLTQPMSNQAAALVVLPVAVKTAVALGLNPRTFAVAVTYAASCSFLTPLEPACVLVYAPGRYRFLDFFKVGSILTLAVFIIVMLLVPIYWPLR